MQRPDPPDPGDEANVSAAARSPKAAVTLGGEFRNDALERTFNWARLDETVRHSRWLLIASAVLNALFLISDWRFHGTDQFWIAVPARLVVVLASLACLPLLRLHRSPAGVQRVMGWWMGVTALGVAALVSSHSELALFVLLLLPMIFYLGVPLPFTWTAGCGVAASALLLMGYEARNPSHSTMFGLGLALATLNVCLMLVVSSANRLRRLEWHATGAAHAIAKQLADNREMLEKLFAAAPVPMVVTRYDDGRILQANASCAEMFGIRPEMVGVESFQRFYADPQERLRLTTRLERDGQVSDFETRAICADGKLRTVMVKAAFVEMAIGKTVIAGIIDISDRKAVETSLEWLASTDALTRLPNRLSFFSSARAEMMRAMRLGRPLSLMMVDLDHFKAVNDTYGHQAGDQALKAFGALCQERLRSAITGRLGGEEFGVLLPDTDGTIAVETARGLCAALTQLRLVAPNEALRLSASIGVTTVRHDDHDFDAALARADRALYAAKRNGRNRVEYDLEDVGLPILKAVN